MFILHQTRRMLKDTRGNSGVLPLERGRSLTEGVAGVSSFGFSGTNAHALMQRAEDGSSGAKLGLIAEWARGS